jgi:hypothetical protein
VKTGVQSIAKAVKTLDSGFRRNDVKKNQIVFFTPSPIKGEGIEGDPNSPPPLVGGGWGRGIKKKIPIGA